MPVVIPLRPAPSIALVSLAIAAHVAFAGCANSTPGDVTPIGHTRVGQTPESFEAFVGSLPRVVQPQGDYYLVNSDIAVSVDDETLLRSLYEERFEPQAPAVFDTGDSGVIASSPLVVVTDPGGDEVVWPDDVKTQLTYCVSDNFGGFKAIMQQAMAEAAGAWEAAAGLDFQEVQPVGPCVPNEAAGVLFAVTPPNQGELAAIPQGVLGFAFFPHEPQFLRRVVIFQEALAGPAVLQVVLRHELGHVLGFRHEFIADGANNNPNPNCQEPIGDPYGFSAVRLQNQIDNASIMQYPGCNGLNGISAQLSNFDTVGAASLYGPSLLAPVQPGNVAPNGQPLAPGLKAFNATATLHQRRAVSLVATLKEGAKAFGAQLTAPAGTQAQSLGVAVGVGAPPTLAQYDCLALSDASGVARCDLAALGQAGDAVYMVFFDTGRSEVPEGLQVSLRVDGAF